MLPPMRTSEQSLRLCFDINKMLKWGVTMNYLGMINKYSGLLVLPLTWLAYFTDYGTTLVDKNMPKVPAIVPDKLTYGGKVFITIMFVVVIVYIIFYISLWLSLVVFGEPLYPILGVSFLCFGVVALFKDLAITPFKSVNIFWHLASLSAGFWIFSFLKQTTQNGPALTSLK